MIALIVVGLALIVFGSFWGNEYYLYPQKIKQIYKLIDEEKFEEANKLIGLLPDKRKFTAEIQYIGYEINIKQNQYYMALYNLMEIIKRQLYTSKLTEEDTRLKIADIYNNMGKYKKELEEYRNLLEKDPSHLIANFKTGERLFLMKNYAAAQPYLETAQENDPQNPKLLEYLANIHFLQDEPDMALDLIERAIRLGNKNNDLYLVRAKIFLEQKEYDKAKEDLDVAAQDPNHSYFCRLLKGIIYFEQDDKTKAEDEFSESLIKFNDNYDNWVLKARSYYAIILQEKRLLKDALRQYLFIQNSGKAELDISDRINAFKVITGNKQLNDYFEMSFKKLIEDHVEKTLFISGYQTLRKEMPSEKMVQLLVKKNVSSGQSMRMALAVDFNLDFPQEKDVRTYLDFIIKHDLTSGYYYSLFGLNKTARSILKSKAQVEVEVLGHDDFIKIMNGDRKL